MLGKVRVVGWLLLLSLSGCAPVFAQEALRLPDTPRKPVTDTYHGVRVTEDYRWLENGQSPAVRRWVRKQNAYTSAFLRKLPAWEPINKRLRELNEGLSSQYEQFVFQAGKLFALEDQVLVTLSGVRGDEPGMPTSEDLVDPEKELPGKNAVIKSYYPSVDAKLVAVELAEEGTEEGSIYVYEVETGKRLPDVLPKVFSSSGGSLAWKADGSGFYYTRHPRGARTPRKDRNAYQHVYFHELGKPMDEDAYVLGREFPRLTAVTLATSPHGRHLMALLSFGTNVENAVYLLDPAGRWKQVADFADQVTGVSFGLDNDLYLISEKDAPRGQLLRLSLADPRLAQARVVVPQGDRVLQMALPTRKGLFVVDNLTRGDRLRVLTPEGKERATVPLKPMTTVGQLLDLENGEVLYRLESYRDPPTWYRYETATGKTSPVEELSTTSEVSFDDIQVVREWATSKDGTRVPLTVLYRKGTPKDGRRPTLLTGYGGYGESQVPDFLVDRMAWFEQGGVYAVAHVRGGGELGAEWRRSGQLTKKQNAIDDFAACLRHLVEKGYTCPEKLAITGASQGGVLVGAALTQFPGRFRALVGEVGAYDLLRSELHPNEAYSVTEQGSVADPAQFQALYAYSPYHRVVDGTAYPAVFLLTGENDNRVDPANSWKMAARLQAATASRLPVLLWTASNSGHDNGARGDVLDRQTDIYAFLFRQLGVDYKPVAAPKKAGARAIAANRQSHRPFSGEPQASAARNPD